MATNVNFETITVSQAKFQNRATGDFISRGEKLTNRVRWFPLIAGLVGTLFNITKTVCGTAVSIDGLKLDMVVQKPMEHNYLTILWPQHNGDNQLWKFEHTSNGYILSNCHQLPKNRHINKAVLIQDGEGFRCVSWDSIKEDPEKVKFAYWSMLV
jgi:hypothetical protein